MKRMLLLSIALLASNAFSMDVSSGGAGPGVDAEMPTIRTAARRFSIKDSMGFRAAAFEGALVATPVRTHSYALPEKEFKRIDKLVCAGKGHADEWVTIALAYRYGVPSLNLQISRDDALRILLTPAQEEDISALFHIAAMVADDEVSAYFVRVGSSLAIAERLALKGNAPLLTVLLEIDQQTDRPILSRLEYENALMRIIATTPNARAHIALAQCTDRFPLVSLGYYQEALKLEHDNVDALLGAGIVIDNGCRKGVSFLAGTPSSLYYFREAYSRGQLLAGNYYGSSLYERAAITEDIENARMDFRASLEILVKSTFHDQDALLSLADYHAIDHAAKCANFGAAFECIKRYMRYKFVDQAKVKEVIRNLKASMIRLGVERTGLFRRIVEFQARWGLEAGAACGAGIDTGSASASTQDMMES
jgi:hypothetical protein